MKTIYFILAGFLLTLAACNDKPDTASLVNNKASLPPSFNFDKMGLKVITSSINKKRHTMSILYGNEQALNTAKLDNKSIIAGETFALVTWSQQADEHWFGAKIPADLLAVEVIKTTQTGENGIQYQRFEGKTLAVNSDTLHRFERINYILGQKPSVMP